MAKHNAHDKGRMLGFGYHTSWKKHVAVSDHLGYTRTFYSRTSGDMRYRIDLERINEQGQKCKVCSKESPTSMEDVEQQIDQWLRENHGRR